MSKLFKSNNKKIVKLIILGAPTFIKESPISNESGFVKVDKHTLIHPDYPNIFALGTKIFLVLIRLYSRISIYSYFL